MREHETVAHAVDEIGVAGDPWAAFRSFLEEWAYPDGIDRWALIAERPRPQSALQQQWAILFAAAVEVLAPQAGLEVPAWTSELGHPLPAPWFPTAYRHSAKGQALMRATTPGAFASRNIYLGDRLLSRA